MADDNKLEGGVSFDTTDAKANVTELNRAIKVLDTGFKASAASLGDWSKTTEGNEMRMKSLASIMDLQRQKIANLTQQYDAVAQKEGASSKAAQDLEIKINREKEALGKNELAARECADQLDKLGSESKDTGNGVADAGDKAEDAAKKTSKYTSAASTLGDKLVSGVVAAAKAAAAAIAAVGTAAGAAAKAAFDMATGAGEMADDLLTTSAQTGVSAQKLQEWGYAARFIDTDVSTMTGSMAKMVRQMGSAATGSQTAQKNFKRLGVDIYDSNGKLRDSEAVFADAIDALGKVGNESQRDAMAMAIFGKSAQELNPLIKAGGAELRSLSSEAQEMGVVMSDSSLQAIGAFDDSMQRAKATAEAMKNSIGATVIPAFQPLVDTATSAMSSVAQALQNGLKPGELNGIITALVSQLSGAIQNVIGMIQKALPLVMQAVQGLLGALIQQLPGLLNTLLPAAMQLLQSLLDAIMSNLDPIIGFAVQFIMALANFLIQNAPKLLQAAVKLLMALVDGLIQHIPELIPVAVQMIVQLAVGLIQALPQLVARLPEIVAAIVKGITSVNWLDVGWQLISGLIQGLAAALKGLWDGIIGVFRSLWDGIKSFFGIHSPSTVAADAGGQIMAGLVNGMQSAQSGAEKDAQAAFGGVWNAAQDGAGVGGGRAESVKAGADVINGLADGITEGQRSAVARAKSTAMAVLVVIRSTLGVVGSVSNTFITIGKAISNGIANGIKAGISAIRAAAIQAAQAALAAAKSELDINSPSRVAERMIGLQWGAGVAQGIANSTRMINQAIQTMSSGMQAAQMVPLLAGAGGGYSQPSIDSAAIGREIARELAASGALKGDIYMDSQRVGRVVAPAVARANGSAYTTLKRSGPHA